jgi:hypothetical protein
MLVINYKAANETIVKHAETRSRLPRTIYGTQNDIGYFIVFWWSLEDCLALKFSYLCIQDTYEQVSQLVFSTKMNLLAIVVVACAPMMH